MREPGSYIVRIYRQGFQTLCGVVEDTRSGATRAFRSGEELLALLRSRTSVSRRPQSVDKFRSTR
jgi:hypothetical protein